MKQRPKVDHSYLNQMNNGVDKSKKISTVQKSNAAKSTIQTRNSNDGVMVKFKNIDDIPDMDDDHSLTLINSSNLNAQYGFNHKLSHDTKASIDRENERNYDQDSYRNVSKQFAIKSNSDWSDEDDDDDDEGDQYPVFDHNRYDHDEDNESFYPSHAVHQNRNDDARKYDVKQNRNDEPQKNNNVDKINQSKGSKKSIESKVPIQKQSVSTVSPINYQKKSLAEDLSEFMKNPTSKGQAPKSAPLLPSEVNSSNKLNDEETETELEGKDRLYYSKQPRPVQYKPYTQSQYNLIKPKEYVVISKIKPDLNSEELKTKRANIEKIKELSKNIQKQNQDMISQLPKLPPSSERSDMEINRKKLESKHMKGIEFAKNISKPKGKVVEDNESNDKNRKEMNGRRHTYEDRSDPNEAEYLGEKELEVKIFGNTKHQSKSFKMDEDIFELERIEQLELAHLQKRKQIEAIRKSMGLND